MSLLFWLLFTVYALVAFGSAIHALLYKRTPSAALGWIAVCLLFPLLGPLLYFLFGINRIRTRARKMAKRSLFRIDVGYERWEDDDTAGPFVNSSGVPSDLVTIARISDAVTRRPLVAGNQVIPLHNGEEAYPAMLEAVEKARRTLFLSTYIFDTDETGRQFITALSSAARRGVDVRVLLDGIGELYSKSRAADLLRDQGVRVARFLPPSLFPPSFHVNLRDHRKILVADNEVAFVGGMNIGDRHLALRTENPSRVIDVHFQVSGPVVTQLEQTFLEDWGFITGEHHVPSPGPVSEAGTAVCRTISDGPNEDLDKLTTTLIGAVASAQNRIFIMTPYFLPSRELIAAIQIAALRGVQTHVFLPAKNNLPFVHWASCNMLWELLIRGVRIFCQPPPFVHSKLFVVDECYSQIGSANIDPRSLRLNFEMGVEVYDEDFTETLAEHFYSTQLRSEEISLLDMDNRSLPIRIRDATAWLFSPYL